MFPIGPDVCGVGGVGKCPGCVTNFSNTNGSSPDSATFIIKLTTFNVPVAGFSLGGITIGVPLPAIVLMRHCTVVPPPKLAVLFLVTWPAA